MDPTGSSPHSARESRSEANQDQPSLCEGVMSFFVRRFYHRVSQEPAPATCERPIRSIFPTPPEREYTVRLFDRHMQDYLPKEVLRRLAEVRTSDDLKHLTLEVRVECARYNALSDGSGRLSTQSASAYDYTNLAEKWAVLEALLGKPCIERRFELLEQFNTFDTFEGPTEIIERMRNQFHTVIVVLFGQFRFEREWRTLSPAELLKALKNMSEIAAKLMPSSEYLDQSSAIPRFAAKVEDGDFHDLADHLIGLQNLADQLHCFYLVSRVQQKNIHSILSITWI